MAHTAQILAWIVNGVTHCRKCLTPARATELSDTGNDVGEAYDWTVDLHTDSGDFVCGCCDRIIKAAPILVNDDHPTF